MSDEKIYRAEAAHRLLNDDIFVEALTAVRMDALFGLAECDPTNADDIRRYQAIVVVTDQLRARLEAVIIASGVHDGGMTISATRKPANKATN